ncbi:DoxX family protein [Neptunitalea lumnitzerae]|uniref:DoxX-like family protein n=1 Tax=Neptunitalea lumnitzerae TaxID=2965509 RepID=A0ABQ5MIU6_9FLAO|nr:hypothetical protein [Neptunitalea sp. Y10]GLB49308.1 hypothetical protein Y10_16760 [Neptunitalea sp. Y10]
MKPFIALLVVFVVTLFITKIAFGYYHVHKAAIFAITGMLLFASLGHFMYTEGMQYMIPSFFPFRFQLIVLSGILEIVLAFVLLIPKYEKLFAWVIIVYLICVLPFNIYSAVEKINYQNPKIEGPGLSYLWLRIPIQLFYIGWLYFLCIIKL